MSKYSFWDDRADCRLGLITNWHRGVDYDTLHILSGPVGGCECDACDRGREWERAEEELS